MVFTVVVAPAAVAGVAFTVSAPPAGAVVSGTTVKDAAALATPALFVAVTACAPEATAAGPQA